MRRSPAQRGFSPRGQVWSERPAPRIGAPVSTSARTPWLSRAGANGQYGRLQRDSHDGPDSLAYGARYSCSLVAAG
jgi:hypothetical protein